MMDEFEKSKLAAGDVVVVKLGRSNTKMLVNNPPMNGQCQMINKDKNGQIYTVDVNLEFVSDVTKRGTHGAAFDELVENL